MKIQITSLILTIVTNIIDAETTKDPLKDIPQKGTIRTPQKDFITSPNIAQKISNNNLLKSEDGSRHVLYKSPQSLTRLAKSLTFGIDPYFNKDYFEPFERRPKPATLIAFRKNSLIPRQNVKILESSEVAELQSPYNEIGSFWQSENSQL